MANVTNVKGREDTRGAISQAGNEARQRMEAAGEAAKDYASNAADKAKEFAGNMTERAKDAATAVGEKADDAVAAVGGGMRSLAGTIREKTPHEGMIGRASEGVAGGLEKGGRYLQQEGLSGMAEDVGDLIRRNPIPAMLVGVGLGILLARLLTPRR
jgi:ElaB/YqjD/DUF883 family membrane-anchored ribosome-binding protein